MKPRPSSKRNFSKGNLVYSLPEQSFYYEPWLDNNFTVILGNSYLGIDIDLTNNHAVQVSGFSPIALWKKQRLVLPKCIVGTIRVETDSTFVSGTGVSYGEDWPSYYDNIQEVVCLGDTSCFSTDVCVNFAGGCFAVINSSHQLKSVWLKPIFDNQGTVL